MAFLESFDTETLEDLYRPGSRSRDIFFESSFLERPLYEYCQPPVTGDLTFFRDGRKHARVIGDIGTAYPYFNLLKNKGSIPTLFLHRIEKVESSLEKTVYDVSPAQNWRFSNVSASISTQDSTIGFHADTMDVIIVQTTGSRLWRLWRKENMEPAYVEALQKGIVIQAPEDPGTPDITFNLEAGDALHIPAYWGHDGVTTSSALSFSLSLSWYRFTPYVFLFRFLQGRPELAAQLDHADFRQPCATGPFVRHALTSSIATLLDQHGIRYSSADLNESIDFSLASLTSPYVAPTAPCGAG